MAEYLASVDADVPRPGATFLRTQDIIADPIGDRPRRAGDRQIARRHFRRVFNATGKRSTDLAIARERLLWR
jgi:xanthine dehydrogenase YagR molybdenum-binding subunit